MGGWGYVSSFVNNYNISNPTSPVRIGEFNAENLNAPAILAITDTTLYVANQGDNTIEIYNISNPTTPVRVMILVQGIYIFLIDWMFLRYSASKVCYSDTTTNNLTKSLQII